MLNENKIRLMTELAIQEKKEGKQNETADNWFKGDYISKQLLVSFLCATVAFAILFGLYAFYNLGTLLTSIYSMDIMSFVRKFLFAYLAFLVAFLVITCLVYISRYNRARKGQYRFYRNLRRLQKIYGSKDSEVK